MRMRQWMKVAAVASAMGLAGSTMANDLGTPDRTSRDDATTTIAPDGNIDPSGTVHGGRDATGGPAGGESWGSSSSIVNDGTPSGRQMATPPTELMQDDTDSLVIIRRSPNGAPSDDRMTDQRGRPLDPTNALDDPRNPHESNRVDNGAASALDAAPDRARSRVNEGDRDSSDRYDSDRYDSDRYDSDRYDSDRYDSDRHDNDRYGNGTSAGGDVSMAPRGSARSDQDDAPVRR